MCLLIGALTKQLQEEYNADYNDVAIKDLFTIETIDSSQPVCIYFTVNDIPNELLECLYVMGNKYRNDLFDSCWRNRCKQCNYIFTFKEVHEKVCKFVLDECKNILKTLEQKTMTLENVDKYFQEPDLESNLNKLCQGIQECLPDARILPAKEWVHGVVVHIQNYKKINDCMNAATTVLELKKSMNLTGDFTVIDTLAQRVSIANVDFLHTYLGNLSLY